MIAPTLDRQALARRYDLAPSPEAAARMQDAYARMRRVVTPFDWAIHAPYVEAINRLKAERRAVILAHNYMTPEIYHGVADVVGDSLQLAIRASEVDAEVIVQCGVHFMAETSKILNPGKTVLIPDREAGCSLAESVTPADIEAMRARHPGAPVVTYVNTSAEVKAVSDVCCTSSNAAQIVAAMESETVIMAPDKHLARNVAKQVPHKRIVWLDGACVVHERFTADDLRLFREGRPDALIIAHPECPTDVVDAADFAGSTSGIIDFVRRERPREAMLVTECSMASNISDELPEVEFVGPCNMCPYMKTITLEKILWSLHAMEGAVEVDPEIAAKARAPIERMIALSRPKG